MNNKFLTDFFDENENQNSVATVTKNTTTTLELLQCIGTNE
jgi:hypothetical protein